jgi:hypothetical protein
MRSLGWWKAWWTLEPRGGERGDYQAALLALPHAQDDTRLIDCLRMLWDCWNPPDKNEKSRRKRERREYRKRRAVEKAQAMGRELAAEAAQDALKKSKGKRRGHQHRHPEREGDA